MVPQLVGELIVRKDGMWNGYIAHHSRFQTYGDLLWSGISVGNLLDGTGYPSLAVWDDWSLPVTERLGIKVCDCATHELLSQVSID